MLKNRRFSLYVVAALILIALATLIPFGIQKSGIQVTDILSKPEVQAQAPSKIFNATEYKLTNGMRVVVIPNHRVPVVTHMVWYRVGAADEPRGQSGIAHFLEHLMFKGSGDLLPGEFSKTIRSLGGQDNAFTSQDYTAYFQSISKDHLDTVMQMEAGRMRGMNPPLEEVESERKVILEERSQRTDNNPSGKFSEHLNSALFVNHPYGIPIIGWRHEIEDLSWDAVKAFYDLYYAPNNAILVVSGDVKPEEVLALAQKHYGGLQPETIPPRTGRTSSPPLSGRPVITMRDKMVRQPSYHSLYRAPSCRQNKEDCLALMVLENILSGGASSRLYKSLVVEQKVASNAGLSYRAEQWDDATAYFYATPVSAGSMDAVESAMDAEIRHLIQEGVSEEELQNSIQRMQADAIYSRDSVAGPAMLIGYAMITGSSLDDIEYWPRDIAKVTAEQVQDVARRFLNPDNSELMNVRGHLLPEKQEQKPQRHPADINEQEEGEE